MRGTGPVERRKPERVGTDPEQAQDQDCIDDECTDDDRIRDAARAFGAKVIMTSSDARNGTERCAEALAQLPDEVVDPAIEKLANDLESGRWQERYQELVQHDQDDFGYRILIAT